MVNAPHQTVGVVHLPKCGGSAVLAAVRSMPGSYTGPGYIDHAHRGSQRLTESMPADRSSWVVAPSELTEIVASHRIVMGHYSTRSLVEAGCSEIAVQVREPRSRIISKYRFWQGRTAAERAADGLWGTEFVATADNPLFDFLSNTKIWTATKNRIASKTLLRSWSPPLMSTSWSIGRQAARTAPWLSVVEWSSDSQAFVDRLAEKTGVDHQITIERVNETQLVGEPQVIDAPTLRLLDELTDEDSAFLEWLMDAGRLRRKSRAQLEEEFEQTCERLAFEIHR